MHRQALALSLLAATIVAQQPAEYTPEVHPLLPTQECTRAGCKTVNSSIVLDSNYRWLHNVGGYDACHPAGFNTTYCSNVTACGLNCALEGVSDYSSYGIATSGNAVTLNLFTNNGTDASSPRAYLLQNDTTYNMFKLLNKEFTYDVDVSKVPCGVNGALYFSEMTASGDASAINTAGAQYGTGYCDAQCPKNTFVAGQANLDGTLGACCNEMDIWEANNAATALTPHPCNATNVKTCTGTACTNDFTAGTCDQGGCDFNAYRMGQENFYGPGLLVDTTKPFTVVTQFVAKNSQLTGINRLYKQNGKVIQNAHVNVTGMSKSYNSISDSYCEAEATAFNEGTGFTFEQRGGMKQMGEALERGMVLVFSIWQDSGSFMQWLDGETGDVSVPGNLRGPCGVDSGRPADIQANFPDSAVTWSNIKIGDFGTTY